MSGNIMRLETLAEKLASQAIDEAHAEYLYGSQRVEEAKQLIQRSNHYHAVY